MRSMAYLSGIPSASSLHQALHLVLQQEAGIVVLGYGIAQVIRQGQHKRFCIQHLCMQRFHFELIGHVHYFSRDRIKLKRKKNEQS